MLPNQDQKFLDKELAALEVTASNFGLRFISDSKVRVEYSKNAQAFSVQVQEKVRLGQISPKEAAGQAQQMRNILMNAMRGQTSDFGLAIATFMKKDGRTLQSLEGHYAKQIFSQEFSKLTAEQQNKVWVKIIQKAGEPQLRVSNAARWMGRAGRGLFALTAIVAVYHVAQADDKVKATAGEGAAIGGGMAGAASFGAAGVVCGPAAIVCVPLGIFVGGFLGAAGADWAFQKIWNF